MNSEIIQNVAYDKYDDIQHDNFIFSQNLISLFWGLFNDETDLRVRKLVLILLVLISLVPWIGRWLPCLDFVGLAYQGKATVFRLIIEYS
jgi:hypothetical protein